MNTRNIQTLEGTGIKVLMHNFGTSYCGFLILSGCIYSFRIFDIRKRVEITKNVPLQFKMKKYIQINCSREAIYLLQTTKIILDGNRMAEHKTK